MSTVSSIQKHPGRPRNEAHSDAAKAAALELLNEQGYTAINMETIAQRTGIARKTLYRRWPHKGALMLDAFAEVADALPPLPDTGSLEGDLQELLRDTTDKLQGDCGFANRALVAEGLQHPEFAQVLKEQHFSKRRQQASVLFQRARDRGECVVTDDAKLADMLLGPLWYRLLIQNEAPDDALAEMVGRSVATYARHG
jgi:AcrR family transcriptional regulator